MIGGYTAMEDKIQKENNISWKIVFSIIFITIFFVVALCIFKRNDPFKEYTKYIGKQYTELSNEYEIEQNYENIFSAKISYSPGQVEFDKSGGTFSYTCVSDDYPLTNLKPGEIISATWSPDNDFVSESDINLIIQSLENVYGKCKNVDRNEYTMEYIWENVNKMDIRFFASIDSFYIIGWNQH